MSSTMKEAETQVSVHSSHHTPPERFVRAVPFFRDSDSRVRLKSLTPKPGKSDKLASIKSTRDRLGIA
jgi:hypothetical protein